MLGGRSSRSRISATTTLGNTALGKNWNWWSRKLHRWGAVLTVLPMLLVITTGLLLQVKKQVAWVQPPTQSGKTKNESPEQSWDALLQIARSVPEARVEDWSDVDRIDVRPGKGIAKLQTKQRWEIQIDLADGRILSSTVRRSDWIESLHDGSYFSDFSKLWIFLPNGLILLGLWGTGVWLWLLPWIARRNKRRRNTELSQSEAARTRTT